MLLQFLSGQGVSFGPWVVNNSVKMDDYTFSVGSVHALLHGLSVCGVLCSEHHAGPCARHAGADTCAAIALSIM